MGRHVITESDILLDLRVSAFLDGNTYEELAERMKVPLGTMKSWIRRGLLKLRDYLER